MAPSGQTGVWDPLGTCEAVAPLLRRFFLGRGGQLESRSDAKTLLPQRRPPRQLSNLRNRPPQRREGRPGGGRFPRRARAPPTPEVRRGGVGGAGRGFSFSLSLSLAEGGASPQREEPGRRASLRRNVDSVAFFFLLLSSLSLLSPPFFPLSSSSSFSPSWAQTEAPSWWTKQGIRVYYWDRRKGGHQEMPAFGCKRHLFQKGPHFQERGCPLVEFLKC